MHNVFAKTGIGKIISLGCNAFPITSYKQLWAHLKYCQVKIHVQTACESHDLNMDFR